MDGIDKLVHTIYVRFVLRDVVAKIVPSLVFLVAVHSAAFSWTATRSAVADAQPSLVLFLAAISWTIAFAIQEIGDRARILDYGESEEGLSRAAMFARVCSEEERALRERYVVIKEASGNLCVAVGLGLLLLILSETIRSGAGRVSYDHSRVIGLLVVVMLIIFLGLAHKRHVRRQREYSDTVLKERASSVSAPSNG